MRSLDLQGPASLLQQSRRISTSRSPTSRGSGGDLAAEGVRVAFGGVVAVAGVDLKAPSGRVTSVIGPNGAGKTTLLNLVSGFQPANAGTISVGSHEITGHARA